MPYNTPISATSGQGGPRAGFSSFETDLLSGDARAAAGLPAYVAPTTKSKSLDGTANGLGKDDFLKLLLTQLSNQDPLKPLEDKEFIAQLAQFNSLEQMVKVNESLTQLGLSLGLSQASTMIGKAIVAKTASGQIAGMVSAVKLTDGKPLLVLDDGTDVEMANVVGVFPDLPSASGETDDTTDGTGATDGTATTTP
jgi:flagellar basal-body rod modification protein FlgD